MSRVKFNDVYPGGWGEYEFPINHDEEDEFGITQDVTRTPTTGGVAVRQIGASSYLPLTIKGQVLQREQIRRFWYYTGVCMGSFPPKRTILFIDQLGIEYEVLITAFRPKRERVALNPRGANADEKLVKWSYALTMDVVRILDGWP